MHTIFVRNVNDALPAGVAYLKTNGVRRDSRNGPVLVSPVPVTTIYSHPLERVLFDEARDANPFFHVVESLWMLAGRDDLKTLTDYVSSFSNFSDDGKVIRGAYGARWRDWFYVPCEEIRDQLPWAIARLKKDPNDRRVVIGMYDPPMDQKATDNGSKDIPCNLSVAPWIDTDGKLSMTIFCRSNDIIWGAYGANAVHFSFLMEYLAAGIGVEVGTMYQVSNNYHGYLATIEKSDRWTNPYEFSYSHFPLAAFGDYDVQNLKQFDEDLTIFFDEPSAVGIRSRFLRQVACPIVLSHQAYRNKKDPYRFTKALEIVNQCRADDWKAACIQWLSRRQTAAELKKGEPDHA